MKLVIQIPAFNEEATIERALAALPTRVDGLRRDREARHRRRLDRRHGRAGARGGRGPRRAAVDEPRPRRDLFARSRGSRSRMGADVIVNFDADLQYDPADIPALVAPILGGPRRSRGRGPRAGRALPLLARQAAPPAARHLGRAAGRRHRDRRRGLGLPRALARGRAADQRLLEAHLHARDPHPGRLQGAARGLGPRPGPSTRAALAPLHLDREVRPAPGSQRRPDHGPLQAAQDLLDRGRPLRRGRSGAGSCASWASTSSARTRAATSSRSSSPRS